MTILYRKLEQNCSPEELKSIAGLIYDTDPYIYPAMFSSKQEAEIIIPKMFQAGDVMFNVENIYIAEYHNRVVGMILWKRGPMAWDPAVYFHCGGSSPYIKKVRTDYFSSYKEVPPGRVSLINVCVSQNMQNKGIAKHMLDAFFNDISGPYELYVLKENPIAVNLYLEKGFIIIRSVNGFNIDETKLPCYQMFREEE